MTNHLEADQGGVIDRLCLLVLIWRTTLDGEIHVAERKTPCLRSTLRYAPR